MRKLLPNLDREDGLDTVLEVPVPEEIFNPMDGSTKSNSWSNVKTWMKCSQVSAVKPAASLPGAGGGGNSELPLLLNVVGAPLIPLPVQNEQPPNESIKNHPIESSTAKYIVQQYLAATGGLQAMNSVSSMYAIGKVRMTASEFHPGDQSIKARSAGEVGAFVLWAKNPDLWFLELVFFGYKMSAGSDGKVAWRQTPWHQSHALRGPPRPLRRLLQGLDPRTTASLFSNAVCIGEKSINNEGCFILKLEAGAQTLKARSSSSFDIIHHTMWGYFSQRTGLLLQFEDTHLLRMKGKGKGNDSVFWETSMESLIEDYRFVDGVNIAHSGHTVVTLFRYGHSSTGHKTRMEESWTIEEVDFNVWGLSTESFLPPADLKKEDGE
ncbi:uncharacterized protein LOC116261148 [Nymphaea colorata]|nr:uncharacterized protein LOC116261148 [Nymphaea colorata]